MHNTINASSPKIITPLETSTPTPYSSSKKLQGQAQINGQTLSVQLMDTSLNLDDLPKQEAFLADTKELHQKREVHQKGIFHTK